MLPPVDERIYSPAPLLREPRRLFHQMTRDAWRSRSLAWRLAVRDIKALYRQSVLGYLWAFMPPLLIAASFIVLRDRQIFTSTATPVPYPAYVIVGALVWQNFSDAVLAPLRMVVGSRDMLVKISFPHEALILGGVIVTSFGALVRAVVVAPVLFYYGVQPGFGAVLAIPGTVALIVTGTAVGLLLAPVGALYKDVEKSLAPLLMLWLLVTPVAYPTNKLISILNPVSPLLDATRAALLGIDTQAWPICFVVILMSGVTLCVGWLFLRLAIPHVVARLGM